MWNGSDVWVYVRVCVYSTYTVCSNRLWNNNNLKVKESLARIKGASPSLTWSTQQVLRWAPRRSRHGWSRVACIFVGQVPVSPGTDRKPRSQACLQDALRPSARASARQISSSPRSVHSLPPRTRAWVKGNEEFWDFTALSLVSLRESQSRLILLVVMEKAPYFKMRCLHLAKMFRGFKKWMPKEKWDELLEFVCTFHRGMEVFNAGTSPLPFFTVTPVTHFFLIWIL